MAMTTKDEAVRATRAAIDRDRDFVIGLTRDLVRIPTVNPKFVAEPAINREAELQAHLDGVMAAEGFKTKRWDALPGRPNLIGDWPGDEERSLLLCGHVDVVPVERGRWSLDPFGGEIRDGRLYGRGALDMKGGLAACVAAARAIRAAGVTLGGRLSLHAVVDEEAGGFGAIDAVAKGHLAKGYIVAEPTWGNLLPAAGGLEWVRVIIHGRTAHSGWRFNEIWPQHDAPDRLTPGVNAIELATRFLVALRDYESGRCRAKSHPLMPPGMNTISPGVVQCGAGLGPDDLPMLRTNPAIIPDVATIDLDMKFLPHEKQADVRHDFEDFVHHFAQMDPWMRAHPPTVKWQLGGLYFPPMNTPTDHPLVTSIVARKSELGHAPEIRGFEAVADAAHYAGAGIDGVIFGPSGQGLHGDDEFVDVESLVETAKVIAAASIDWCGVR
jgi:acetylornithine deacetylase/succinyl-diaminopimelate desuccinylase family protein